ncbi:putative saccharopine dehydrogenase NADP binding domain [Lyophyllum shimeji]|uniref:Saccharopine dehydrogenase NADP binding domain n=1 Tax=Lyophyllum shimeji TaxID=47721 RepID=A0A9P3PKH5_LYOSH|nr:putative saccharopine dehydrogenase NADP binding domain [Lyophyllum shimeji]
MSSPKSDIVVLGATGFTGRLTTRYLVAHPQFTEGLFSFSIAARSQSKLHNLVQELGLPASVNTLQFDVDDYSSVEAAVKSARVVINTVGPYWRWGTPVVKACALNGVHYVDLSGEHPWLREIIYKFDYVAMKSRAVIVPSCGYDSIPSDLSAYVSNRTLKAYGDYDVDTSITAHKVRGGISGGTLNTIMTVLEEVPRHKLRDSSADYALSPVGGRGMPKFRFLYNLSIPGEPSVPGAFFGMQPTNRKLVQRTYGLLEMQARSVDAAGSQEAAQAARRARYGPTFVYDEFLAVPSRLSAVLVSTAFAVGFGMLALVAPIRWLVKKLMPPPGSGPSEETMQNGFFIATNHTTSVATPSSPPVHVKTVFTGDRDPGYALTAIMLSESALSLLLPPVSSPQTGAPSSKSEAESLPEGLPDMARKGGILTPMTAFGDVLITRLVDTERFAVESSVVGREGEQRKDV